MGDHEVLLLGHGTVENLDDLPAFLSNIRRGRPSPPELVREIQRRYEAIGGSPLLRISRELAGVLEARLGSRVHLAMRFWHPFAKDVLAGVASSGCRALFVVPLAPYSGHVYAGEMARVADELGKSGVTPPLVRSAPNWGKEPLLVDAFAAALLDALARLPEPRRVAAHVLFTAHSLPLAIVRQGDPYPEEVRATAEAVAARAAISNPWRVVYQSQGATPDPWLGPDVSESLCDIANQNATDVVFCPIGFLSDHIEILYDLDIEARSQAERAGLTFTRTASLNASPKLADAIGAVARRLVAA
jgi:protoporphyrin/coproporphyrin ferrochelatase